MSDNKKKALVSALKTFIAVFLVALGTSVKSVGHIDWNFVFLSSLILSAGRTALSEVINSFLPVRLGGRK